MTLSLLHWLKVMCKEVTATSLCYIKITLQCAEMSTTVYFICSDVRSRQEKVLAHLLY